jgi:flagellar hook-associated protein 2
MSMSVGGLISGLDTTNVISQLLQAEGAPQAALKTRLSVTNAAAAAYRSVNSRFDAVRSAAESLLKPETWTAMKATSSQPSVAATTSSSATAGSLTFTVDKLATAHAVVNRDSVNWTSSASAYGAASIDVFDGNGASMGPAITIGGTGTVADAAAAINASSYGLSAAVVQVSATEVALQVTAKDTGAAKAFSLSGAGTFSVNTQGQDAQLSIGTTNPYTVSSATNSFSGLMPGTTLTVSKADPATPVTVTVGADPDAVAGKVQSLVDALNQALGSIKANTNPKGGAASVLKGDSALRTLAGQLLDAASFAVGADGSPAVAGIELKKDGTVAFDKGKFLTALAADPAGVQRLLAGGPAGPGPDATSGTADDIVPGVAQRVFAIAKTATDATTGTLTLLADGRDKLAADIQSKIEAWDVRLAKRKEMLTRQFTAMETALSALRNQSTWLAGQINALPTAG